MNSKSGIKIELNVSIKYFVYKQYDLCWHLISIKLLNKTAKWQNNFYQFNNKIVDPVDAYDLRLNQKKKNISHDDIVHLI